MSIQAKPDRPLQTFTHANEKISRIERRKTEFRDKITKSALKLFAKHGMTETSIAAIITEADIAHKTFFNHFPTRDHLLQHIVSSHTEHAYSLISEAMKRSKDPAKQLEYCLIKIARTLEPLNPQLYKELVTFYFVSNTSTKEFRDSQKSNFTHLIQTILQEAKNQQGLKLEIELDIQSEMIVGIFVTTLLSWSVEENFPIVDKTKQAITFINQSIFK
jgi:AcrR family transcriptional regulator